jgi:hypothetical protein
MDPVSAVVVVGLVGGFLAWAVRADRRRKRAEPDSPVVTVSQARPGEFVRIVGIIVEGPTMRALAERVGANPFVLEDATGRIAVDPNGAVIRLALDHHVIVQRGNTLPLHDPGFVSTQLELVEIYLDEGVLPNGARVVVEAMVQSRAGNPDGGTYRAGGGELFLAGGGKRSPSISDLPASLDQALAPPGS